MMVNKSQMVPLNQIKEMHNEFLQIKDILIRLFSDKSDESLELLEYLIKINTASSDEIV
jgi:hypothetical protein